MRTLRYFESLLYGQNSLMRRENLHWSINSAMYKHSFGWLCQFPLVFTLNAHKKSATVNRVANKTHNIAGRVTDTSTPESFRTLDRERDEQSFLLYRTFFYSSTQLDSTQFLNVDFNAVIGPLESRTKSVCIDS